MNTTLDFKNKRNIILGILYLFAIVFVAIQQIELGENTALSPFVADYSPDKGWKFTHYNNYLIFKHSFIHMINGVNMYVEYQGEGYWDLFKYSPSFAVLMYPYYFLSDYQGLILWNLINSILIFLGIVCSRGLNNKSFYILGIVVLAELWTNMNSAQSNGLIAGLLLWGYIFMEKNKPQWASLMIVLSALVKVFGLGLGIIFLFYPKKEKFIIYGAFWLFLLLASPLLFISWDALIWQYKNWGEVLFNDYSQNEGVSVLGWIKTWFGVRIDTKVNLIIGIVLLFSPLLRWKSFSNEWFRIQYFCLIMIWLVIFNYRAESPTYIIAIVGVAFSYIYSEKRILHHVLFILTILFTVLGPADIYPANIRNELFKPFVVKAVPCIFYFIFLLYELLFKSRLPNLTKVEQSQS